MRPNNNNDNNNNISNFIFESKNSLIHQSYILFLT